MTRGELKQWLLQNKEKLSADLTKGAPQEVKPASEVAPPKRCYSVTDSDSGSPPWKKARGSVFNKLYSLFIFEKKKLVSVEMFISDMFWDKVMLQITVCVENRLIHQNVLKQNFNIS